MTVTNSFRVSVYTKKGNEKISICHSENQKYSDSENLKLEYYPHLHLQRLSDHIATEERRFTQQMDHKINPPNNKIQSIYAR
jgi:hypothetical protein